MLIDYNGNATATINSLQRRWIHHKQKDAEICIKNETNGYG
jgi:hypothetical protein